MQPSVSVILKINLTLETEIEVKQSYKRHKNKTVLAV